MNAESLRKLLNLVFYYAYGAGHQDTVNGTFTDVHYSDRFNFHDEAIGELIADGELAALAQAGEGVGPATVIVDAEGVRFGPNCWISHEKITGLGAKYLNERHGVIGAQYMAWVDASLATAPINPPEVDSKLIPPGDAEAVATCLDEDAAALLENDPEDERAHNMQRAATILTAMLAAAPAALCEDCPPADYPTDATRCKPCPRRAAPAAQGVKPGWGNDYLLDLMGEWDCPLPIGMFNQLTEKLNAKAAPAVEVDEAMVERALKTFEGEYGRSRSYAMRVTLVEFAAAPAAQRAMYERTKHGVFHINRTAPHTKLAISRLRDDRYINRNFGAELFEIERDLDFQRSLVLRLKLMVSAWEKAFDLREAQSPKEPDHG